MGALRNFTVLLGSVLIMSTGCSSDNGDEAAFEEPFRQERSSEEMYTLTISVMPSDGGGVSHTSGEYKKGQTLELRASSNYGYIFTGWGGSISSMQATHELVMDSNKIIIANFAYCGCGPWDNR
jgi:hypothetical protein